MTTLDEARQIADQMAAALTTVHDLALLTTSPDQPAAVDGWWAFGYGPDGVPGIDDSGCIWVRQSDGAVSTNPPVESAAALTASLDVWSDEDDTEEPPMTTLANANTPARAQDIPTEGPPLHGVLAPEGIRTGDGRSFNAGSMRWRDLPLPLMVQNATAMGHEGAVRAARIDSIERDDSGPITKIRFSGVWATDGEGNLTPVAAAARDEVRSGVLRGVSVDLDDTTVEFLNSETGEPMGDDMDMLDMLFGGEEPLMNVVDGRISGATMCSIPAFQQAYVADGVYEPGVAEPGDDDFEPIVVTADAATFEFVSDKPWSQFSESDYTDAQWARACLITLPPADGQDPNVKALHKLPVREPGGALNRNGCHAAASVLGGGRGGVDAPPDAKRAGARKLVGYYRNDLNEDPPQSLLDAAGESGASAEVAPAFTLVASAGTVVRAADYADPGLTQPTPLTVTADGRVFGHLAQWGTCHIGIDGACVTPPHSMVGYAYFATGCVETDDGEVPVGPITLGTGHAGPTTPGRWRPAVEHYDNTGTAVADVAIGEDDIGIWVAGRVRPWTTVEQIETLRRGGALSGDWRRIGGNLELVAALAVNVPGYPIPRPALAASAGHQEMLVAAGIVAPRPNGHTTVNVNIDPGKVAREVLAAMDRRTKVEWLSKRVGRDRASRIAAAAAKIEEG